MDVVERRLLDSRLKFDETPGASHYHVHIDRAGMRRGSRSTGPLVTVAPEAIQEYRISTNNFSAEYGRTSGVLANAITRAGSNRTPARPAAARMRPQLGSLPKRAVLVNGDSAMVRAMQAASR